MSFVVYADDEYEKLNKAIGAYNQGAAIFKKGVGNSWLDSLINQNTLDSKRHKELEKIKYAERSDEERLEFGRTVAIKYAMNVMHDTNKINLPKRSYIFEGAAEVPDNPATPELEYKAAWCFAYGEEEWLAGKVFDDVKKAANSEDKYGNPQIPEGRAQCS